MMYEIPELPKNSIPTIKKAGENVGVDLENPIDCSLMRIYEISEHQNQDDYSRLHMIRRTVLNAFISNEDGSEDELSITFERKSNHRPKFSEP